MHDLLASDSSGDFSFFEDVFRAIIACAFHTLTIELFKLASRFSFVKKEERVIFLSFAGNALRTVAVEHKLKGERISAAISV